jgi:adenosylmethionine-8-amino-7-oxononanoate aminotransferase
VQLDESIDGPAVELEAYRRGVIVRSLTNNTLVMSPPFISTDDEVRQLVSVLAQAINSV